MKYSSKLSNSFCFPCLHALLGVRTTMIVFFGLVVAILSSCNLGSSLPESYGIYFERDGKWVPLRDSGSLTQFPSSPRFLIFTPAATQSIDVQRVAAIHPTLWVRSRVETVLNRREGEPNAYTVENSGTTWTVQDRVFPLSFAPHKNNKSAIIATPRSPLEAGLYTFRAISESNEFIELPFLVDMRTVKNLSASDTVDQWITTLAEGTDDMSKIGAFAFSTARTETGGLKEYHGRIVLREEVRPTSALSDLENKLESNCKQLGQTPVSPDSIEKSFSTAALYRTLDPTQGEKFFDSTKQILERTVVEAMKKKDVLLVSSFSPVAARWDVSLATRDSLLGAEKAVAESERDSLRMLLEALSKSEEPGIALLSFDAVNPSFARSPTIPVSLKTGTVHWGDRYDRRRNHQAYVRDLRLAKDGGTVGTVSSAIDPRKNPPLQAVDLIFKGVTHESDASAEICFVDAAGRDAFLSTIRAAKTASDSKYSHAFVTKAVARPGIWSERIWLKSCPSKLTIDGADGRLEISSDSASSSIHDPGSKIEFRGEDWIRFRSLENHPVDLVVTRFPYSDVE